MALVYGWSEVVFLDAQTAIGTPTFPLAADAIRIESCDMGPSEAKSTRVVRDKTIGRDETNIDWTHGFVGPIPFKIKCSFFGGGVAGAKMQGLTNLFPKSAGLIETYVAGTRVDYTIGASTNASSSPANILGCSITRGDREGTYAETGVGAIVKTIKLVWGEQDTYWEFDGEFAGKTACAQTLLTSNPLLIGGTTMTVTAGTSLQSYGGSLTTYGSTANAAFDFYVKIESEVVRVTQINYATDTWTIVRAQAGTAAAQHAQGVTISPYIPTATYTVGVDGGAAGVGNPASEVDGTISPDNGSTTFTILKGSFTAKTGIDFAPPEFGNVRRTRVIVDRIHAEAEMDLIFDTVNANHIGRANQFTNLNYLINNGGVAGSKLRIQMAQSQDEPFATPFPKNNISTAKVKLRARGSAGQDTFTLSNL